MVDVSVNHIMCYAWPSPPANLVGSLHPFLFHLRIIVRGRWRGAPGLQLQLNSDVWI
jgi:hypothetical protein